MLEVRTRCPPHHDHLGDDQRIVVFLERAFRVGEALARQSIHGVVQQQQRFLDLRFRHGPDPVQALGLRPQLAPPPFALASVLIAPPAKHAEFGLEGFQPLDLA